MIDRSIWNNSMRGEAAYRIYLQMERNKNIILLTGDLGFKIFDRHREDFKNRFINCGASEQAMLDTAIGIALSGKIPVCYSITPFLLYRPFEALRTYINHEHIPVKLIGSGRGKDYIHDGISHWSEDDEAIMNTLPNIISCWPKDNENLIRVLPGLITNKFPVYINISR